MADTSVPHLPAELWAQILQSVDDPFMIWVTCRQVSRAWRKEGERIFRATYLPVLRVEWFKVAYGRVGSTLLATTDEHSIDPQSSMFSLVLQLSHARTSDNLTSAEWLREAQWILNYDDYRLWVNDTPHAKLGQAIWFETGDGRYTFVGSVETRTLSYYSPTGELEDLARRRITCDWKVLMDALFAEEMYVRRRHPGPSFYELGEQGVSEILQAVATRIADPESSEKGSSERKRSIADERHIYQHRVKNFLQTHLRRTEEFQPLYAAAFQERLRRAFSSAGVDLYTHHSFTSMCDLNQQLDYNIEKTGCLLMMESRLERLQAFADGIWKRKFGE